MTNSKEHISSPIDLKTNLEKVYSNSVVDKLINFRNEISEFMVALNEMCKTDK